MGIANGLGNTGESPGLCGNCEWGGCNCFSQLPRKPTSQNANPSVIGTPDVKSGACDDRLSR